MPKATKLPINVSVPTSFASTATGQKKRQKGPTLVKTELGLGFIYDNEPMVQVKIGQVITPKIIVHLVKDDLTPRKMGGKPKKVLMTNGSFTIIKPAEEEKPKREKRPKGEAGPRDYSRYKFDGKVYTKGRLCHAIISKFAEEKKPTLAELKIAFPDAIIRPFGHLFLQAEEAIAANEKSNRSRFFSQKEEIIKIKGSKIAVTNQVDSDLINRLMDYAKTKYEYKFKKVDAE